MGRIIPYTVLWNIKNVPNHQLVWNIYGYERCDGNHSYVDDKLYPLVMTNKKRLKPWP